MNFIGIYVSKIYVAKISCGACSSHEGFDDKTKADTFLEVVIAFAD